MKTSNLTSQMQMVKFRSSNGTHIEAKGENPKQLLEECANMFHDERRTDTFIKIGIGAAGFVGGAILKPAAKDLYEWLKNKCSHRIASVINSDAQIRTGWDVCNSTEPERRMIFPFLREGGTLVVFSPKKTGKTTFIGNLSCSTSAGECDESLPPYEPVKLPVLYYNMEMDDGDLQEFFGLNPNFPYLNMVNKNDWLSTEEVMENVKCNLKKVHGSALVVIDNLTSCGLNSTGDAARQLHRTINMLKAERLKETGFYTTFILITHTLKDAKMNKIDTSAMRGSSVLADLATSTIGLYPTSVTGQVVLKVVDLRSAPKPEECYLMERISEPGNHHFKFIQMIKEEDVLDQNSPQTDVEPEKVRSYRDVPDDEREEMYDFWREKRDDGNSYADISSMTLEYFHIEVTRQTIYNFFNAE